MFQSARLKLTAWYVLIIMLISVMFSVGIYSVLDSELTRFAMEQQRRIEREQLFIDLPVPDQTEQLYAPELLEESKSRLKLILVMIDTGILLVSAGASYFLAGRTLAPIEEMLEEQKRFTADASHELRTPLTAIKSETEVALRDPKLKLTDAKFQLKSNLEEVNKLTVLSDYLLTLSRYQHVQSSFTFAPFVLQEVLTEVIKKVTPIAKTRNIAIETTVAPITLTADKKSIAELCTILLENAIKFSKDNGTIELVSKLDGHHAVITVKDHGIGIEAREISHIFDRFYQSDKSRSSGNGGYGLGLAIAKKITEIHEGSITVASTPNVVTTFTARLPLKQHPSRKL